MGGICRGGGPNTISNQRHWGNYQRPCKWFCGDEKTYFGLWLIGRKNWKTNWRGSMTVDLVIKGIRAWIVWRCPPLNCLRQMHPPSIPIPKSPIYAFLKLSSASNISFYRKVTFIPPRQKKCLSRILGVLSKNMRFPWQKYGYRFFI